MVNYDDLFDVIWPDMFTIAPAASPADVNRDGVINYDDLFDPNAWWEKTSSAPRPVAACSFTVTCSQFRLGMALSGQVIVTRWTPPPRSRTSTSTGSGAGSHSVRSSLLPTAYHFLTAQPGMSTWGCNTLDPNPSI